MSSFSLALQGLKCFPRKLLSWRPAIMYTRNHAYDDSAQQGRSHHCEPWNCFIYGCTVDFLLIILGHKYKLNIQILTCYLSSCSNFETSIYICILFTCLCACKTSINQVDALTLAALNGQMVLQWQCQKNDLLPFFSSTSPIRRIIVNSCILTTIVLQHSKRWIFWCKLNFDPQVSTVHHNLTSARIFGRTDAIQWNNITSQIVIIFIGLYFDMV